MSSRRLLSLMVFVVLFLWPGHWFWHLLDQWAYVSGLLSDYLIIKLYPLDFVIILLNCLLIWQQRLATTINAKHLTLWIGWLFAISTVQLFTPAPLVGIVFILRLAGFSLFFYLLTRPEQTLANTSILFWGTILSSGFQLLISSWQWLTQQSVAGYWLLGEPNLATPYGLATTTWFGQERVLAYGTTAHPNILAGFLLTSSIVSWLTLPPKFSRRYWGWLLIGLVAWSLVMTQSWSAGLAAVLAFGGLIAPNQLTSSQSVVNKIILGLLTLTLLFPLFSFLAKPLDYPSLSRRHQLNLVATETIKQQPWFGVGANQFTAIQHQLLAGESVRFNQPTHHVLLLIWAETGLLGLIGVTVATWSTLKSLAAKQVLLLLTIILPLASWDHYLWTQPAGWMIIGWLFTSLKLTDWGQDPD